MPWSADLLESQFSEVQEEPREWQLSLTGGSQRPAPKVVFVEALTLFKRRLI